MPRPGHRRPGRSRTKISGEVRSWRLHLWIGLTFAELARRINPIVRGWMQYYGAFYRSELLSLLRRISACLMRWFRKKYKTIPVVQGSPQVLAGHHQPAPQALRPLGMDTVFLVIRATRAE
ncbi:group II intron maturase-specific domain-containing protein [Streptomyces sp. NPDC020681]|uniref:group II intron maturase-specific domain-containing protein n=1 Tax=Streptomyces sp. NPDC020681 TaxID=3365083 RepID=UPI0037921AFB